MQDMGIMTKSVSLYYKFWSNLQLLIYFSIEIMLIFVNIANFPSFTTIFPQKNK